jgi:hypothetical protein
MDCPVVIDASDPVEEERVLLVDDFWDVPNSGIANFHGVPHSFSCIFDEARDDWSNKYLLRPLDGDTVARALPARQDLRMNPSDDEHHYRDVIQSLRAEVRPDPQTAIQAIGRFRHVAGKGLDAEYTVQ